VESVPSGELEIASVPRDRIATFILPLTGSKSGDTKLYALGVLILSPSQKGRFLLISDDHVLVSQRIKFKLLRISKPLIQGWQAFRILRHPHGPITDPVLWHVKVSKPADFGHDSGSSVACSMFIEATSTWVHQGWVVPDEKYAVRFSLSLEAEPNPRVYLLISIDGGDGNVWEAHSQWVPMTGSRWGFDVKDVLGGEDGEAGDRP